MINELDNYKCKEHKLDIACINCIKEKFIKYEIMVNFLKNLAHESVYERYINLNELNWAAFELLKEIGEI